MKPREVLALAPLVVFIVWIGLYPKPFIDRLQTSVDRVVVRINPEYRAQIQSRPSPVVSGFSRIVPGGN